MGRAVRPGGRAVASDCGSSEAHCPLQWGATCPPPRAPPIDSKWTLFCACGVATARRMSMSGIAIRTQPGEGQTGWGVASLPDVASGVLVSVRSRRGPCGRTMCVQGGFAGKAGRVRWSEEEGGCPHSLDTGPWSSSPAASALLGPGVRAQPPDNGPFRCFSTAALQNGQPAAVGTCVQRVLGSGLARGAACVPLSS